MRITRAEAVKVAQTMAGLAYNEDIKKAKVNRNKIIRELIEKNIPAYVREFVDQNATYFRMSAYLGFASPGQTARNCAVRPMTPYDDLVVSYDDMQALNDAYKVEDDLLNKRCELHHQILAQLMKLGTTKKVIDQFPEAAPFFTPIVNERSEQDETLEFVRNSFKSKLNDND